MSIEQKAVLRRRVLRALVYLFCILLAITTFYPLYTMFISSTHDSYNIVTKLNLLPGEYFVENYQRLTKNINIWQGFFNSFFVAVISVALKLYFTSMAAYAFAKFNFKMKNFLFGVVMVAMMLPGQLGIIGYYRELTSMHLLDSYLPLFLTSIADCFVIFFFKQYLDGGLPNEIIEAAYVDGCREIMIFHRITLPIMSPALVAQGVLSFIGAWNSYMMPLILLRSQNKMTLPLLVATVRDSMHAEYGAQYVGMVISVVPLIVVYCFASKVIMEKISIGSAVKG
mgnify:CR=1 FL=1